MVGNAVTTAIITNGMTCNPSGTVCTNGMITTFFSLYCVEEPVKPVSSGGGGGYMRDAWNKFNPGDIHKFYKPVSQENQYYVVPRDQEAKYFQRHKIIVMKVKLGERTIEKEYSVPEKRANVILKVMNVMNATINNIQTSVSNIKRITSEAVVSVKNFRLKK